jgi:hypothetical protein
MTGEHPARRLWRSIEPIHAVTYFAPGCRDAAADLGLRGFWMGYFAFRAAPLGAVGPAPVEALFAGFHPERVARALPDAWSFTTPDRCIAARSRSAAEALRGAGADEDACARAASLLEPVVAACAVAGRALGAANRALDLPEDPVERLWQLTTTLREHRGDGHVAAFVAAGLTGLEANVLRVERDGHDPAQVQAARGWSPEDWATAAASLAARGVDATILEEVEVRTDGAAWEGGQGTLGPAGVEEVVALLATTTAAAEALVAYPNPIGLPRGR